MQPASLADRQQVLPCAGLDFAYPEAVKLGGLGSGAAQHLPRLGELGKPATAEPTWPAFCWNANPEANSPTSGIITVNAQCLTAAVVC